ncbi:hypothetical protein [Microbacterium paludicola]|uniref:hypothetical protein n=1 Tax=Microbacterium paludicola TaxID=300019 RepID=UPI0011A1F7F9|nr:hypothetical protein [Microbacterium paludicola]
MRELRGIAETLDPHVAESLRIVEHFDALVARRVGLTTLVRAATMLTGAAAGVTDPDRQLTIRIDAAALRDQGAEAPVPFPEHWQSVALGPSSTGRAWLERIGEPHVNDLMVLERLAQAVQITIDRTFGWGDEYHEAVALLLDVETTKVARARLAARLGLKETDTLRVIATPRLQRDSPAQDAPHAHADIGELTFFILRQSQLPELEHLQQVGISPPQTVASLPQAAEQAVVALRFARPDERISFLELGLLADAAAPTRNGSENPAVRRIAALMTELNCPLERLEALDAKSSAREIAGNLGVHHSTIAKLRERVDRQLGYDTASPFGALRFSLDLRLARYERSLGLSASPTT